MVAPTSARAGSPQYGFYQEEAYPRRQKVQDIALTLITAAGVFASIMYLPLNRALPASAVIIAGAFILRHFLHIKPNGQTPYVPVGDNGIRADRVPLFQRIFYYVPVYENREWRYYGRSAGPSYIPQETGYSSTPASRVPVGNDGKRAPNLGSIPLSQGAGHSSESSRIPVGHDGNRGTNFGSVPIAQERNNNPSRLSMNNSIPVGHDGNRGTNFGSVPVVQERNNNPSRLSMNNSIPVGHDGKRASNFGSASSSSRGRNSLIDVLEADGIPVNRQRVPTNSSVSSYSFTSVGDSGRRHVPLINSLGTTYVPIARTNTGYVGVGSRQ